MAGRFIVSFTGDFYLPDGAPRYPDFGQASLAAVPNIDIRRFAEHRPVLEPDQVGDANGIVVLGPRVTAASLAASGDLLALGRFGVGYDSVDIAACTAHDVLLFITPGAVDRPVAEATLMWMMALSHHLLAKDRLVRTARWNDRSRYLGRELRDRVLGIVGLGRIGLAVAELARGFGLREILAFDPQLDPAVAARSGVRLTSLDELLAHADFVSLHCPLADGTRNLIGARELALMRPDAYLINTARGGIVDEDALEAALRGGRLAGAALDCFVGEPLAAPSRFADLENVLLAPHSIAHTHELFRDIGRIACGGMVDLLQGRVPPGIVNREVLDRPSFREKWRRLRGETSPLT